MAGAVALWVLGVAPTCALASWNSLGPFGGGAEIVRALPASKGAVLAATRTGLLFRSDNGGASWKNLAFPAQSAGVLHALEIDPRSDGVWYAGVEGSIAQTSGIYKTTDAGRSWNLLPATRGIAIWSMAFYPGDSSVIAAGAGSGIYFSTDAGNNWKLISRPDDPELKPVVSLAFNPSDSKILYAGTTHLPWRTLDGGATWQSIHTGMIDDSDVFSIQVDQKLPDRVLASACSGAYLSQDAAQHWKHLETPTGAFRTYFIALDPRHEDTIFAGTSSGLIKSVNSGAAWRKVSLHAVKSISFDRFVPGRIFFASTDGGLLVSTDNGDTLRESNTGFSSRTVTSLAGAGSTLYISAQPELYRTDNLAARWQPANETAGGKLLLVSAAPDAPRTLFGAGYHDLLESIDGGQSWHTRRGAPENIHVKALLALSHGALLAGSDWGLFRSTASGAWNKVTDTPIEWIQRSGPNSIAALNTRKAEISEDEGATWRSCTDPAPGALWYALAVNPQDPSDGLAATSLGLFHSQDGCRTWSILSGGLDRATVESVVFHPTWSRVAFAAQGGRIFQSSDDGQTWEALDEEGDPALWPSSLLVLASAPDWLFALVPGRGVFSTTAFTPAVTEYKSNR